MARKKTNIDRLKELEKIAEKLGIGQNREVKCVACLRKIKFKNAITLTNKKKVTYLCKECYKKLEAGELNKEQIEKDDILKQIEKLRKDIPKIPAIPTKPTVPAKKITPWEPYTPEPVKWEPPYQNGTVDDIQYGIYTLTDKKIVEEIFKIEPKDDNKTNRTT